MSPDRLRVSDADRDQVAEVLHTAYAEGRITLDEHAERTEAALQARTFADLVPLTDDLVPTPARPAPLAAVPAVASAPGVAAVAAVPGTADSDRVSAVFSSSRRRGPWTVGPALQVSTFFGEVELDLTEATLTGCEVVVSCTQVFGQITIRVRPGTTVRIQADNVLADSSVKRIGEPDSREPTVVVRGTNILGDIQVRGPKKALSWRRHVA